MSKVPLSQTGSHSVIGELYRRARALRPKWLWWRRLLRQRLDQREAVRYSARGWNQLMLSEQLKRVVTVLVDSSLLVVDFVLAILARFVSAGIFAFLAAKRLAVSTRRRTWRFYRYYMLGGRDALHRGQPWPTWPYPTSLDSASEYQLSIFGDPAARTLDGAGVRSQIKDSIKEGRADCLVYIGGPPRTELPSLSVSDGRRPTRRELEKAVRCRLDTLGRTDPEEALAAVKALGRTDPAEPALVSSRRRKRSKSARARFDAVSDSAKERAVRRATANVLSGSTIPEDSWGSLFEVEQVTSIRPERTLAIPGRRDYLDDGGRTFHQRIVPACRQVTSQFMLTHGKWSVLGLDTCFQDGRLSWRLAHSLRRCPNLLQSRALVVLSHHPALIQDQTGALVATRLAEQVAGSIASPQPRVLRAAHEESPSVRSIIWIWVGKRGYATYPVKKVCGIDIYGRAIGRGGEASASPAGRPGWLDLCFMNDTLEIAHCFVGGAKKNAKKNAETFALRDGGKLDCGENLKVPLSSVATDDAAARNEERQRRAWERRKLIINPELATETNRH